MLQIAANTHLHLEKKGLVLIIGQIFSSMFLIHFLKKKGMALNLDRIFLHSVDQCSL